MLEKLKAFLNGEIDLSSLKKVIDIKNIALNVVKAGGDASLIKVEKSDNSKNLSVNVTLNINSGEVTNPELLAKRTGELINEHIQTESNPIFETSADGVVSGLSTTNKYSEYIDFFRAKIPHKDHTILRAAYFIRQQMEDGHGVGHLVQGIATNYGSRGTNILNLCGRGYFENFIKPLYDALEQNDGFEKSIFLSRYEIIIENAPMAYFVNRNQSLENIVENLLEKIPFSKRYGQKKLAIHAIGKENVEKSREAIADPRIAELIELDSDIDLKKNVLTLTIYYIENK